MPGAGGLGRPARLPEPVADLGQPAGLGDPGAQVLARDAVDAVGGGESDDRPLVLGAEDTG